MDGIVPATGHLDRGAGSGVDAAPGLLSAWLRERNLQHNFLEEDLESLPFSSGTFDIVAGFTFQYAGNFTNALSEAKRALKLAVVW